MKIAIIGAGNIGGTLGEKWAAAGHLIVFGVRDPHADKVRAQLARVGRDATASHIPEAVPGAEAVLFAVPGRAMEETIAQIGPALNGKILIDAGNSVAAPVMHSLDALRHAAPDSPLFRAFSSLGWENFAEPVLEGQQVDLFYCGDDDPARAAVEGLIAAVGLRPIYLGGPDQAAHIDNLTRLWFLLTRTYGRHAALKLLAG